MLAGADPDRLLRWEERKAANAETADEHESAKSGNLKRNTPEAGETGEREVPFWKGHGRMSHREMVPDRVGKP